MKQLELFRAVADEAVYEGKDGCLLYLYRNADIGELNSYIDKLNNIGFEILQRNENYGNYFAELKSELKTVTVYFTPCDMTVRLTVSENSPSPHFQKSECIGNCKTAFYCFENDQTLIDCGMCLLIQCPDYSFFIVDSGHYYQFNDNDRIHRFMRERTPNGQKIVVNGWLVTHAHTDHISKLMDFLMYNCDDVVIEGFYMNLIRSDYCMPSWEEEERAFNDKLCNVMSEFSSAPCYKLHSGERFYIRNLIFDVMYTQEDAYPNRIENFNDTSVAVMLSVEGTRIFIPGDASELASRVLEERFAEELKCDIVQISHHGHSGLSARAYEMINAKLALFPITRIKFFEELPRQEANRRAIELADEYYISSDGTIEVALPYTVDSVKQLPDETFEDFAKIKRLWGYEYSDEYMHELYNLFVKNGGNADRMILPVSYKGTFEM